MRQLNYEEFQKTLQKEIGSFLPQDAIYEMKLNCVEKNNVTLKALSIRKKGENVAPNIYLEEFFRRYREGKSLKEICTSIGQLIEQATVPDIAINELRNYENVKKKMEVHLVSKENNEAFLARGLYRLNEVGAEVVYIKLAQNVDGQAIVRVTNELMQKYKVSPEEVFAQAYENTIEQYPLKIMKINDVIGKSVGEGGENEPQMYVVTNDQQINGATVLLYPETLKKIEERVGGEYYILPSSVHEILAVPKKQTSMVAELRQMVRNINRSIVEPTERLAGEVFEYESKENQLHKCKIKEREIER